MNTVKDSLLILEHNPDTEIYVFYMDIRAFGKGFEDLLRRSKEAGVRYIRVCPVRLSKRMEAKSSSQVEKHHCFPIEEYPLDMIVLSVGLEPKPE